MIIEYRCSSHLAHPSHRVDGGVDDGSHSFATDSLRLFGEQHMPPSTVGILIQTEYSVCTPCSTLYSV